MTKNRSPVAAMPQASPVNLFSGELPVPTRTGSFQNVPPGMVRTRRTRFCPASSSGPRAGDGPFTVSFGFELRDLFQHDGSLALPKFPSGERVD